MERRTFLKSAGALSAGSVLSTLNPSSTKAAWTGGNASAEDRFARLGVDMPLETESNDLAAYTGPWNDTVLHHLLRRSMFGVPPAQFAAAKALGGMSAVVDKLLEASDLVKVPLPVPVTETLNYLSQYYPPLPQSPKLADYIAAQRLDAMRAQQLNNWWFDLMMKENLSLRQKMTLLWTNHFVTGYQTVQRTGYMYTYLNTCMQYSLGNFKDFTKAISIDPAMLVYLNGNQNYFKNHINENFARELMELFTLGLIDPTDSSKSNYTESDVQNAARALTGWAPNANNQSPFVGEFTAGRHDILSKTFLGQTGNWGLDDTIRIIFEQGTPKGYSAAYFVCQKLYANFVYYVPNPSVVDAMATEMINNNFEIAPVMKKLLSSAHFYDVNVIGAQLKAPVEFMGSLVREFAMTYDPFQTYDPPKGNLDSQQYQTYKDPNPTLSLMTSTIMGYAQGQQLLDPPNVKGWPGAHNWISTGTFQSRQEESRNAINNIYVNANQGWNLSFNADLYANQIGNATTISSTALSQALEDTSLGFTLGPLESGDLKTDISKTYPDPNYKYNAVDVKQFAAYLVSLPEFQLL